MITDRPVHCLRGTWARSVTATFSAGVRRGGHPASKVTGAGFPDGGGAAVSGNLRGNAVRRLRGLPRHPGLQVRPCLCAMPTCLRTAEQLSKELTG